MNNKHVKWTAIFIAATDEDTMFQSDAQALVVELTTAPLTEKVNIVLCISTPVVNMKLIYPGYPNRFGLADDEMVTAIYLIEKSRRHNGNDFILMREANNFNMQRSEDIAAFFKAATKTMFKGQRYIMFTWDHGCVYGIFKKDMSKTGATGDIGAKIDHVHTLDEIIMTTKIRNYRHRLRIHKALHYGQFGNEQQDVADPTPQILTVRELCEAIKEGMGGRKMEVMIMTNCYMQAFDTGYELVHAVDYLVAPETFIVMTGFNYQKILGNIALFPALSAKEIAQLAIESYREKSNGIRDIQRKSQALNEVAVSAVDLKHYDMLAEAIDDMAKILIVLMETDLHLIKQARQMLDPVERRMTVMMVDPHFFFNNVGELLQHDKFDTCLKRFNEIYDNAIVHIFAGEFFKPGRSRERFRPKGFTVYFPLLSHHINYPLAQFIDDTSRNGGAFALRHSWDNFVISFAKKVGPEL